MHTFLTGLRHVGRRLARAPLFTALTILTLGVGIGANTAIFSVVHTVLLKPLPFPEEDRLVGMWHTAPGLNLPLLNMAPAYYQTYRDEGRVFQDVAAWTDYTATVTGRGEPERVTVLGTTDGLLPVLGVQPQLGRLFTRQDDQPGQPPRVILTYGYWQRRYGGSSDVVGRTITVDGDAAEIVGVLPASFRFLRVRPDLVRPMQWDRSTMFVGNFSYMGIARLKPGVTIDQANAEVARLLPLVPERFPMPPGFSRRMLDDARLGPNVRPLAMDVIGETGRVLWVLLGTVGVVLLIACANVANLFLVRSEGRQQELALRTALGASRLQVARELLAESLALALAGGALGVVLAQGGIALLQWLAPSGLPRLDEIALDPIVLLYALALSLAAGVLFGLIPVARFGTPNMAALKEGGRSASESPTRHRARNALVVAEIAMALVLLVVSGLMVRTFVAMREVHPGFVRPEEVHTFRVSIPGNADEVVNAQEQILAQLSRIPGVTAAGVGGSMPMDGSNSNDPLFAQHITPEDGAMPPLRRYKRIGPGYLETLGNRLVAGRTVTWDDLRQRRPVVMLSENLAREIFKSPAEAVGKFVRNTPGAPWREVIGVVGDERDSGVDQPAPTIVFWPFVVEKMWGDEDSITRTVAFAVRSTRVGTPAFTREVERAVWAVNQNLPLFRVETLEQTRATSMAQTSFALVMLGIAGAVALLLGIVGVYGVIAYIAAQRTREIGIRMALGAQVGDVSRLFLRHGLWLVAGGIVIGAAAALALTRLMGSMLVGVSATDPATFVAVSLGLAAVALVATYIPARRAARIDPLVALRSDA
jgi:predicted permease